MNQLPTDPVYRDSETGEFTDDRMENAFYWAAQLDGWMTDGPNAGLEGTYKVEIRAGQPILVLDESWSEHNARVITDSLVGCEFPDTDVRVLEDEIRVFMNPSDSRLQSNYDNDWEAYDHA